MGSSAQVDKRPVLVSSGNSVIRDFISDELDFERIVSKQPQSFFFGQPEPFELLFS